MEATVRPAVEADLPAILGIYNHAIEHTTAVFSYKPHTLAMRREWFEAKRAANHPVFVAQSDGGVVGFATFGPFRPWPAYKYTVENSVYVAEHARRSGIARSLMNRLLLDARDKQCHAVIAGIVSDNTASIRLHQSLGFVEVAHFREVGYKFGRWRDLKFFEILLTGPEHPDETQTS